ncbi:MAG: AmmeMemoRadiSam system radical SAM enzyme [Anaerolineae bacterium]|nr:AmmeMemoRadiSam system radical SAM enzyme [Anaerolineae bacterium]
MKEAMLYERLPEGKVRCGLCAHRCVISDGKKGVCQVRENRGGTLYTLVYGRAITQHVDPVEKKPLLHFYPGSRAYSIATVGCNFRCRWCQNWDISQMVRERHLVSGEEASPEYIVSTAEKSGCHSIAYTYTEPTIFFEYAYDTARLAHEAGLANIYVTNGYMTEEMLETFHPYLDAANVDLKAFRDETYRRYVGARLQPVLDTMKVMKRLGIWLEVTTLVIPDINDDDGELKDAADFVANELGVETPWHISRFFPAYQMNDVPPTPVETLRRAREIGLEAGLRYVYVGNTPGEANTVCHACGHMLIRRSGYRILENHVQSDGRCPNCGTPVAGIGMG